jgi:hypothetical protein
VGCGPPCPESHPGGGGFKGVTAARSQTRTHLLCNQLLLSHCSNFPLGGLVQVALHPLNLLGQALLSLQAAAAAAAAAPPSATPATSTTTLLPPLLARPPTRSPVQSATAGPSLRSRQPLPRLVDERFGRWCSTSASWWFLHQTCCSLHTNPAVPGHRTTHHTTTTSPGRLGLGGGRGGAGRGGKGTTRWLMRPEVVAPTAVIYQLVVAVHNWLPTFLR